MSTRRRWLSAGWLLLGACVANDRSDRPPLVAPAPPRATIDTVGFDDAMHIGSDYIYASQLPNRVFLGAQKLAGNLWLLRFGSGSNGGVPVDLYIDVAERKVVREESAAVDAQLNKIPAPPVK